MILTNALLITVLTTLVMIGMRVDTIITELKKLNEKK